MANSLYARGSPTSDSRGTELNKWHRMITLLVLVSGYLCNGVGAWA